MYAIDLERRMVRVTYLAQPNFKQWSETMDAVFADPAYQSQMGMLLDHRAITQPANTAYIKQMVSYIDRRRAIAGQCHWAIVVSDPGSYGMGRMAEQLSGSTHDIRTFKNLAEAEMWLASVRPDPNLPPGPPAPGPRPSTNSELKPKNGKNDHR